jgi:hypothetical protein
MLEVRNMQNSQISPMVASCLEDAAERLSANFAGVFSPGTVARAVRDSYAQLSQRATVRSPFWPTLAERFAREQLIAAAQADGLIPKELPELLFVCERNAGPSQMAASIAQQLAHGRVGIRSAGSAPADQIHPAVREVMEGARARRQPGIPQTVDRRRRPRRGRCDHDGLRRRVPRVSRQAVQGLAGRQPSRSAA